MRLKQKLSVTLAVLLILLHGLPAFAAAADELQEQAVTVTIQNNDTPSEPSQNGSNLDEPAIPENSTIPENSANPEDTDGLQPPEAPTIELEEQSEIPVFGIELVENGENPGLYGTLSHIPENTMDISVEYSFGGESYYFVDGGFWELNEDSPNASPLTQLCMKLDERPYTVWQSGTVNSLYIRLSISCYESDDIRTEPVVLSHQKTYPIPETPPPFAAELVYIQGGYQVNGHFEDFPPDVVHLRPMYSLDGQEYKSVNELYPNDWLLDLLGTEDEGEKYYLQNQYCIAYYETPLTDYVAGKLDRFYILLEITTESGVFYTQAAIIERGSAKPVPEGVRVKVAFPFTMRPLDEWGNPLEVTYGQYQITAREGAAAEQVPPLLPDTLPLEVQLWSDSSSEMLTSGIVQVPAAWKTLSSTQLMAGQRLILSDFVDAPIIPSGTEIATPLGNFLLSEPVTFDDNNNAQVHLVIDVVGEGEAPDVSLQENSYENSIDDIGALSLAFRLKPSGARAITAYSFVEGEEDWTELCDLLARRDLNHNQAMGLYGFVTLLQPNDAPFHDYLNNGIPFLVGLKIEGGTFDGETVILPWPGDYTPPAGIPEPGGSEGNENNAGSGGGDSTEEGQRPVLPQEPEQKPENEPEVPPILSPPAEDGTNEPEQKPENEPEVPSNLFPPAEDDTQAPEEVKPPSPSETIAPEQPITDSGGPENPTDGEKTTVTVPPLTLPPQQSGEDVPVTSIQKGQTNENPPSEQIQSPLTEDTTVPAPATDEKEIDTGKRSDNKPETESNNSSLPMTVAAAIALVGGGIAVGVGVGAASSTAAGSSLWGKFLEALRKPFSKR